MPKRLKADMFLNTHNPIASNIFACNTNVQVGDYGHVFNSTLYSSKNNQKEETRAYLNVSTMFSRRIHYQIQNNNSTETPPTDFTEGLSRVLSGIRAHMSSSIISPPLAHLLVCQESRFAFSHDFSHLPLSQIEAYLDDKPIHFRPRFQKGKNEQNKHWPDSTVYDIVFRSEQLENLCAYELMMTYERGYYYGSKSQSSICR